MKIRDWPIKPVPRGIEVFANQLQTQRGSEGGSISYDRRLLLWRHCGQRMFKVTETDKWVTHLTAHKVCGHCGHSVQSWFTDRSGGVGIPFVTTLKDSPPA